MRLYTYQTPEVWEQAKQRGYLTGGGGDHLVEDRRRPYDWMRAQMANRLEHFSGEYPVWAWPKRPDLREGGHANRGTPLVLLTLEIPPARLVTSDFEAWHYVLNNWYLLTDEVDAQLREVNRPTQEEIEGSWTQIFNPDALSSYVSGRDLLQACVDRVYVKEVLAIRPFTAK